MWFKLFRMWFNLTNKWFKLQIICNRREREREENKEGIKAFYKFC